jgi:uncharacterized protein YdeI (BOF family)
MPKTILLALVILCSAAWMQAQNTPSAQDPQTSPTAGQQGTAASHTSVQGCLQGSDGNFTLTDSSGTTYMLQGDAAKLNKHVGHEVQITGSTSSSSSASAMGNSSQGNSQPTLTVDKVKHISETCKTANK